MFLENENIEFKVKMTDDIYKEVIAFANSEGGIVYIGVDNEGNTVGLEDIDETYLQITNGIRDVISPDVTMFVRYTLQDNQIVKVSVSEGSFKPYYLKSKGLKPSGVYVRQGTSSVQASPEMIRQMIKVADGDVYENMRYMWNDLTFEAVSKVFDEKDVEFSESKYLALGMVDKSGNVYTNLAKLLSDQCEHTIKVGVFQNEAMTKFLDAKEFGGSVFTQLEDAAKYLNLCNRTSSTIDGLFRIESKDYPDEAIREALINAIVHRDYSFSGSVIININDDRIEFISIGGLVPGLSSEELKNGVSQARNKNLANVFHRLELIEAYGTGMRKIFLAYEGCSAQPEIITTPNSFKIVLPNMNRAKEREESKKDEVKVLTSQQHKIVKYLDENGEITEADVQDLLGVKSTRSYSIVREMVENGYIVKQGRGVNKRYVKNDD